MTPLIVKRLRQEYFPASPGHFKPLHKPTLADGYSHTNHADERGAVGAASPADWSSLEINDYFLKPAEQSAGTASIIDESNGCAGVVSAGGCYCGYQSWQVYRTAL